MEPIYIDPDGLLDKKFLSDGGDTCHREGFNWSLVGMMGFKKAQKYLSAQGRRYPHFFKIIQKLHPHPGVLLRHSNPNYDASDWDRMSRDQIQSMVIAMGYFSTYELKRFCKGHLKRGFLFANNTRRNGSTKKNHNGKDRNYSWKVPDLTGPEIWGNIIRSYRAYYLYPLLLLFDFELLAGAIRWRWFASHNIALNHTLSQMQSVDRMPTPISWLAEKIMPVSKLIVICEDHLNDRYVAMPFLTLMLRDAWQEIRRRRIWSKKS